MPHESVALCMSAYAAGRKPDRSIEKAATKFVTGHLEQVAPGNSVELRIPPYVAVQLVAGVRHRRGTPPATVECDAQTLIELATGSLTWVAAVDTGRLLASGERSDLSALFPFLPPPRDFAREIRSDTP